MMFATLNVNGTIEINGANFVMNRERKFMQMLSVNVPQMENRCKARYIIHGISY